MPNTGRILLIEDSPDTRTAFFLGLTLAGHSVLTADNGQQAFDLLERGIRPSVILLDLMLPHISGHDLLTHLRSDPELRYIPTIVVTAMPQEQTHVIADAVLYKPVPLDVLLATVRRFVTPSAAGA